MGERSPILGRDGTPIGYVEGGEAFDLSGRKRCNYSKETGNLFDDNNKTIGHVSLAGRFIGIFSAADKLFPKIDAAQVEFCGIGRTPSQPVSQASQAAASADLAAAPSAPDSTKAIQIEDENEQHPADVEGRETSGTPTQSLSEASQVAAFAELAEAPTTLGPTEAIQEEDGNEQRRADAERRDIDRIPNLQLSEARPVTAHIESGEQSIAHDPTEVIRTNDEHEQHIANAEGRETGGTSSQFLSEPSTVAGPAELAEAPTRLDPTAAIQAENGNEQRRADAERHDISRIPNQQLFEARPVTALIESGQQSTAHDLTEVIRTNDEHEQRTPNAEGRETSGTPSQFLSEPSRGAAPAELAEAPATPAPTEAIQAKNGNEQRRADTERRNISRPPNQELSEARPVTAHIESGEQSTAHDPTEAIQINDDHERHAASAEGRESNGTPSQSLSGASTVVAPAEFAESPTRPDPTEAIQINDDHERHAASAEARESSGRPSEFLSEASTVAAPAEFAGSPTRPDPTEAIQINDDHERHAASAEGRESSVTPSQFLSDASTVAAPAEFAEAPATPAPTEAIQANDENEHGLADAERHDVISRTLGQQVSTALMESAAQLTAHDPTEVIQITDENEQHAADAQSQDDSGTRSQPLSEASQGATLAELVAVPTTLGPTEAIRAIDENQQGLADAERRDGVSRTPNQLLFEARPVTALIVSGQQSTAHDPTEAIQINDEHEQLAANAEGRETSKSPILSEASTVAAPAEFAESPTRPDPTEAIQAKDENEHGLADAERHDVISRTLGQQLSTALMESAAQLTAHDPTEVIQITDENEQHAADRDISGTKGQPLSEASQGATLAELVAVPTMLGPTEAIRAIDENQQGLTDAERRDVISRTPNQQLSTALIESVAQRTAHDPTEVIQITDENEQHAADAQRQDDRGARSQPLSEASQVAAPAELADAPTAPGPYKAIYGQDENGHRAADAESGGIGATLNQPISEPSEARTLIEQPEEPSTAGFTEALHSNDAEKDRVAELLNSLERGAVNRGRIGGTSGQPLARPSEVSTLTGAPEESNAPNWIETFKRKETAKDRLLKFVTGLKHAANAKRRAGSSKTLDQPLYGPTEVSAHIFSSLSAPDSSQEPSTPNSSEALHSKDADKDRLVEILKALERSADANPRGVDGTPSQSPSAPAKVGAFTDAPAKLSALDLAKGSLAEGFHSGGAYKDRIVSVLKALVKRSRGLVADAPRLQQAEEIDLAMTLSVIPDPISPDKRRVQELASYDRERKPQLGLSGQDQVVETEISAPIDSRVYQGSFAIEQQTRPHNAFGMNQQSAPAVPTDPGAERPGRASADTSAAAAVQQLYDASPYTLTPADDNVPENARAGEHHRREGRMPPAVEAFMRRLGEFIGSHSNQAATQSSDGAAELKLGASAEALKDADPVPFPGAPDLQLESSDSARQSGPAGVAFEQTEDGFAAGIESPVELARDNDREGNSGAPGEGARSDQTRTFDDVDLAFGFSPEPEPGWWFMKRRPSHRG